MELEQNQADWQPKDGTIWLREWLAYAVDQVPKLYTINVIPDSKSGSDTKRGIRLNRPAVNSLQTPSLFDFRADKDQGIVVQVVR